MPIPARFSRASIYANLALNATSRRVQDRGARNALLLLSDEQKAIGVVAASAGNHGMGCENARERPHSSVSLTCFFFFLRRSCSHRTLAWLGTPRNQQKRRAWVSS